MFRHRDENEGNQSILWFLVTSAVAAIALLIGLLYWGSWLSPRRQANVPPIVSLSVFVDGQLVDASATDAINVVRGTTVTPRLDIDWRGNRPGNVKLMMCGRSVEAGKPITLSTLGFCTLRAEVFTDRWTREDSVSFEVSSKPRYRATAVVEQITGLDGDTLEIDVRLSSDEFNVENIYLSHVSLWLLDDSNLTLDRLPIATNEPADSGETNYQAEYAGGNWIIRFSRASDAQPLGTVPTRVMVTGSGWKGEEHVEFTTEPTDLPTDEDP